MPEAVLGAGFPGSVTRPVSFAESEGRSAYEVDFSHSCYPKILKIIKIKFNKIFRKQDEYKKLVIFLCTSKSTTQK